MTEFNFYLTSEETALLFDLKERAGLNNLTGNEYARKLLTDELNRLRYTQCRRFDDWTEEQTSNYYDSEEGNENLLFDPLDPCIELDEEGYRL